MAGLSSASLRSLTTSAGGDSKFRTSDALSGTRWPTPCKNKSRRLVNGVAVSPIGEVGSFRKEKTMLWTICVILLVLWLLGFFAFHVGGGLIHLLLVIAVIVVIVQLLQGRRV